MGHSHPHGEWGLSDSAMTQPRGSSGERAGEGGHPVTQELQGDAWPPWGSSWSRPCCLRGFPPTLDLGVLATLSWDGSPPLPHHDTSARQQEVTGRFRSNLTMHLGGGGGVYDRRTLCAR